MVWLLSVAVAAAALISIGARLCAKQGLTRSTALPWLLVAAIAAVLLVVGAYRNALDENRIRRSNAAYRLLDGADGAADAGHVNSAMNLYEQAVRTDPDNPVMYRDLGQFLARNGRYRGAVFALRSALIRRGTWHQGGLWDEFRAEVYCELGNDELHLGDQAAARVAWRSAVLASPSSEPAAAAKSGLAGRPRPPY